MAFTSMSRFWSAGLLALVCSGTAVPSPAAEPLFPRPLHLTRKVVDSVSGTQRVVEEYCEGNRVVTVSGDVTVIVDYARQEVTEVDRRAATYSVTPFADIALAASSDRRVRTSSGTDRAVTVAVGSRISSAGRPVESFEIADAGASGRTLTIDIDRTVVLSRAAVEVLLGAAYPSTPSPEQRAMVDAARKPSLRRLQSETSSARAADEYGLPVEQNLQIEREGVTTRVSSTVLRVGREPAPPALLAIPAGARLVASRVTAIRRGLEELDRLPGRGNR